MKTTIRHGVFETNSSSTHSIVFAGNAEDREYLKAVGGDLSAYDKLFPSDEDLYTTEEIREDLRRVGAEIDGDTLDLTWVDPYEYNFGYVPQRYLVTPAYKVLLVLALRESLGHHYYWTFEDDDDHSFVQIVKGVVGVSNIILPQKGYFGVDHQSRDELTSEIIDCGVEAFIRRKNVIIRLDHD